MSPPTIVARATFPWSLPHVEQIDDEHQRLTALDDATRAPVAVPEVGRDGDAAAAADLHPRHALIPPGDDLATTEAELERIPAVPGRVELLAVAPRHAHVVDDHVHPRRR